ncbi:MAG: RNA-binding protein [Candidatus Saccharibacteria bacterium]|jgi:cold-inducible RNA-binding protein|nr:RNA-binding protein [Patescibacteria group bacterium]
MKKLFVGNLPYSVTSEQLAEIFGENAEVVSANVITDRMNGRSKGFGFVELAESADVNTVVEATNGKEIDGRAITVSEARPQQPRD